MPSSGALQWCVVSSQSSVVCRQTTSNQSPTLHTTPPRPTPQFQLVRYLLPAEVTSAWTLSLPQRSLSAVASDLDLSKVTSPSPPRDTSRATFAYPPTLTPPPAIAPHRTTRHTYLAPSVVQVDWEIAAKEAVFTACTALLPNALSKLLILTALEERLELDVDYSEELRISGRRGQYSNY